jgi:chemotaxis signal transduction protein
MPTVVQQHQELQRVEAAWDSLSLLSALSRLTSQASSGADLSRARRDFSALSADMVRGLSQQALDNTQADLDSKAQVAIDILVRNLFERTADIGFLASDEVLTAFAACFTTAPSMRPATPSPDPAAIEQRLRSYVSFYSVYRSAVLYDTGLNLLAHHCTDPQAPAPGATAHADDLPWLTEALHSTAPYTERYGRLPSFHPERPSLVYAKPLAQHGQTVGLLCLEFKLGDELPAIFQMLLGDVAQSGTVLALVDSQHRVVGASDVLQLPVGWPVAPMVQTGSGVVRHMGREYLVSCRAAQPFEGYGGPGWLGLALIPLELAFDLAQDSDAASPLMNEVASHPEVLHGELRQIPPRSTAIRTALERSVWNGLIDVMRLQHQPGIGPSDVLFAQTLLSEIGATAQKTARAFACALQNLHRGVIQARIHNALHRATVCLQILDRNLYERANDCRWWALTPSLVRALVQPGAASADLAHQELVRINSLYTVYSAVALFDAQGQVVATSRPDLQHRVGQPWHGEWVSRCLQLPPHAYCVSTWGPSGLLDAEADPATFTYAAALHLPSPAGGHSARAVGGIGLVWRGDQQMQAMLDDSAHGCGPLDSLAFVDAHGVPLACAGHPLTSAQARQAVQAAAATLHEQVIELDGHLHGVGLTHGSGYREYRAHDHAYQHHVQALMLAHLCNRQGLEPDARLRHRPARRTAPAGRSGWTQLATFWVGNHWLAIPATWVRFASPDTTVLSAGQSRPPLSGLVELGGQVYPVIDMQRAVLPPGQTPAVDRAVSTRRQLVVLALAPTSPPHPSGEPMELVLRVDALDTILDVPEPDLKHLRAGNTSNAMVHQVVGIPLEPGADAPHAPPSQGLLMVLSPAWLEDAWRGRPVDCALPPGV